MTSEAGGSVYDPASEAVRVRPRPATSEAGGSVYDPAPEAVRVRPRPATAGWAGTRVVDATRLDAGQAAALAGDLTGEAAHVERLVVLAGEASAPPLRDAGLDVEVVAGDDARAAATARYGAARAVTLHPTGSDLAALVAATTDLAHDTPAPAGDREVVAGPIFVGGTGRSGTWAIGRLLGSHPNVRTVYTELRFHAAMGGFADVLTGRRTPESYAETFFARHVDLTGGAGRPKGLQLLAARSEIRHALDAFVARAEHDVPDALRRLAHDLVDPWARGRDVATWVETTPHNARAADALTAVFPQGRVIHTVRDGRDAAASVVTMPWGPDTYDEALAWWAEGIRGAQAAAVNADQSRLHVVRFEELIYLDRDPVLGGLLDFLGISDREDITAYFGSALDGSKGNVGRWRRDLDASQQAEVDAEYRRLLDAMRAEGVECLPTDPDRVDALACEQAG